MKIRLFLKTIIAYFLFHSRLYKVITWIKSAIDRKEKLIILLYHSLYENECDKNGKVSIKNFERQMNFLSKNYNVISLDDAVGLLNSKKIPKNSIAVTFDDGFRNNFILGFPIFKKYKIPVTIFLTTSLIRPSKPLWQVKLTSGIEIASIPAINQAIAELKSHLTQEKIEELQNILIHGDKDKFVNKLIEFLEEMPEDTREYFLRVMIKELNLENIFRLPEADMLSWEEVRLMYEQGILFGAHTRTHPLLSAIPLEYAEKEIYGSKTDIEKKLNMKVKYFAYPYGLNGDFNNEHIGLLKKLGFLAALSVAFDSNSLNADRYDLKRLPIDDFSLPKFFMKISGIMSSP